jgi:hypothetical protein
MCQIIEDNIAGFIIGVISSALVSYIFYSKGKHDAKRQHLALQMDSIRFAMARCDPTQIAGRRQSSDGLEPTAHWIGCMVDVLERTGAQAEAVVLTRIREDMERLIADFSSTGDSEKKKKKEEWQNIIGNM